MTITKQQILDTARDIDPEQHQHPINPLVEFSEGEAEEILNTLNVAQPNARLEWYNCTTFNADELARLANLQFSVHTCECPGCDSEEHRAVGTIDWDHFQGINQAEGGYIDINGKQRYICAHCLMHNPLFY